MSTRFHPRRRLTSAVIFSYMLSPSQRYTDAAEIYAAAGVNAEEALRILAATPLSLHCWQGDDVGGFEQSAAPLGGGLAVTGSYPGKASTADELRADLAKALAFIPGRHRLNLHASYAELHGRKIERSDYTMAEFQGWVDWCNTRGLGFDFNPTFFAHPLAAEGYTLSHVDGAIRAYWIAHAQACRRIAAEAGRQLGTPAMTNLWIPDGEKDTPADRRRPRELLVASLDQIFADPIEPALARDAVESKLFGLGSESYVVGSHEFYLGYAITRQKLYCLDTGHFHPTESAADKVSALLQYLPGLLLHVSRGVRWDSDHVVSFDDPTRSLLEEVVRGGYLDRVYLGLDFFDASINRLAAWIIGARNTAKALLAALLQPTARLQQLEAEGDRTGRLALLEELKLLPLGAVWAEHCHRHDVPPDGAWLSEIRAYEETVLRHR